MSELPLSGQTVPEALDGERLDRAVAMMADVSRSVAANWVDEGHVRVDGAPIRSRTHRLHTGDTVEIDAMAVPEPVVLVGDDSVPFTVVHADDDVVVVDKPAGVVVHPGAGREMATLVQGLLARYPEIASVGDPERPGIVHRIDAPTSGLLVVARTERARESLVEQLSSRSVERRYEALVWGTFEAPTGRIDAPIGRSSRRRTRMAVVADGREAITDYQVVDSWSEPAPVTRLACTLRSGRTHQIRVHLSSIGHPVVGDEFYGGDRRWIPLERLWLHAATLGFDHPGSGERLRFVSPLPPELEAVLASLR